MKKKNVLIVVILIIVAIILTFVFIEKRKRLNKVDVTNENSQQEVDDETVINEILQIDDSKDETIAVIKDKETNNELTVTQNEIKYWNAVVGKNEFDKEKIIEMKIYSLEFQKRNLKLSDNDIRQIERAEDSEDIISIEDEGKKQKIREAYTTQITEYCYKNAVRSEIRKEITTGEISLQDDELKKAVEEYQVIKENKNDLMSDFADLYGEYTKVIDLYEQKMKEQYIIEE